MNLNPYKPLRAAFKSLRISVAKATGGAILNATRESEALGPFQAALGSYVPRQVNPWLYEAIREAVPMIDGAIATLVTMDGIVRVKGKNAKLVNEIREWMETVRVGDKQRGLQAFYVGQGNEQYEQGFSIGEWVPSSDGRDIAQLRVADSKGVLFARVDDGLQTWYRAPGKPSGQRGDGTDTVETLLRRTFNVQPTSLLEKGYVRVDPEREVYTVNEPEADNPYGTSKMRSLEFNAQVLVKIVNAMARTWERYGDPPLHLSYKTKNPKVSQTELDRRKAILATELAAVLSAKAKGNSTDFVTAVGMNDELAISVIGALGIALDPESPTKLVNDQILAKFSMPGWLLGLDGGAGGQAERQSEMVLQASRTRFELRKPGLTHLVATVLRLRGRTWSPGDWELEQELPSLQDMMKIAQANFLNAQAAMVGQGNNTPAPKGIDNNLRHPREPGRRKSGAKAAGDDDEGEPWAQDGDALSRIERAGIRGQLALWRELAADALELIGFSVVRGHVQPRDPAADAWAFDHNQTAALGAAGDRFVNRSLADDAPIPAAVADAFDRGLVNAAAELGLSVDGAIAEQFAQMRDQLRSRGGELIRSATGRAYRDRVIGELSSGAYDGMNPTAVAKLLEDKFGAGDYDWERLTRSEMAIAQSRGKEEQFKANGTELYDYTTAGDDRVSEICQELAERGPYPVGGAGSPIPVVDSHPNCRCSITPHVE